jgi:pyruvate ferredoxin oxidoreductase alpha subunit
VLLPVMVHFDGFILSHVIEPIELRAQEQVLEFLPYYEPQQRLDVDNPITMGPVGMPEVYTESKMASEAALVRSYGPIVECFEEFEAKFGRAYQPVESYRTEDAEILLVTMGGISETAMAWIDTQRDAGEQVGLVRFRLWRPLPVDDFKRAIAGAKVLAVCDRHFSPGGPGGPVAQEIKYMLYGEADAPKLVEVIVGLGGREVTYPDFQQIYDRAKEVLGGATVPPFELMQARGGHHGEI